jgi:hypothetical protein
MNGLSDFIEFKSYTFDSQDASDSVSGTSLNWPKFQVGRDMVNIVGMRVLSFTCPFSYYIFNSLNNTFILTESVGLVSQVVTIPVGNYTTTTFIVALKTELDAASVLGGNSFVYTVEYSIPQDRYIISKTGAVEFGFTFGNSDDRGETNPRLWMGFNGGSKVSTANVMLADFNQQVTGPDYLYLCSRSHGKLLDFRLPQTFGVNQMGLGVEMEKIIVNGDPKTQINWVDQTGMYYSCDLAHFGEIDLFLQLGNSTQTIDLNGRAFSATIGVLTSRPSSIENQQGTFSQDRITKRVRPN